MHSFRVWCKSVYVKGKVNEWKSFKRSICYL